MNRNRRRALTGALAVMALFASLSSPAADAENAGKGGPKDPYSGDRVLLWKLGAQDPREAAEKGLRLGREEVRAERAREAARRKGGFALQAEASKWTELGPRDVWFPWNDQTGGKISGLIADVKFHPSKPDTIWIASAGGGVWKTENGGKDWTPTMEDLGRIQIGAIAVSRSNPKRLYAGSGCADSSADFQVITGLGVFVSNDGGNKWEQTPSGASQVEGAFYELDVDPADEKVVLAATTKGLYRSEDGGDNWSEVLFEKTTSLSRCRTAPKYLYASTLDEAGVPTIWKSTDGGREWDPLPGGGLRTPADLRGRVEIAVAPSNPRVVYAHVANRKTQGTFDFAVSNNGGESWTSKFVEGTTANMLGSQGSSFTAMAVQPTRENTVWVGGLDVWRTTDGGESFTRMSDWGQPWPTAVTLPFVHADQHAYVFDSSAADAVPYFATDGGLFKTENDGTTFVPVNKGLGLLQPYYVCSSPHDSGIILGGAQDNGPFRRDPKDGKWYAMTTGDGMGCLTHPTDVDMLHLSTQNEAILRSTDGKTFKESHKGLTDAEQDPPDSEKYPNAMFTTILQRNPVVAKKETIYTLSQKNLWLSTDNGETWRKNENAEPKIKDAGIGEFSAMAVHREGNRIAVSTAWGYVFETKDEGKTPWNRLHAALPSPAAANSLEYDRSDKEGKTLWASSGTAGRNASCGCSSRLFRTTDGGETWDPLGQAGLPDVPVFVIRQDPNAGQEKVWWAGTYVGVYRSGDNGRTWQRHGTALPNAIVMDLDFYKGEKIRVATFGRGFWEAPTQADPPAPPMSAEILFPSEGARVLEGAVVRYVASGTPSAKGATLTYRWSWGDQSRDGLGETAEHAFTWHGTYLVRLTATDSLGYSTTVSRAIVVEKGTPVGGEAASFRNGALKVQVDYRDPYTDRLGEASPLGSDNWAYFYFSGSENPEVVVKVLDWDTTDGKPTYYVSYGGLTSFEYAVTFTLYANGKPGKSVSFVVGAKSYAGGADSTSLPRTLQAGAALISPDGVVTPLTGAKGRGPVPVFPGASAGSLSLAGKQVSVSLKYKKDPASKESFDGVAFEEGDSFGYFHFDDPANPEVFVKVLDFGPDRPFLLFWGGLTSYEYTLTFKSKGSKDPFVAKKEADTYNGGANTDTLLH